MQVKSEKDPFPLRKVLITFVMLLFSYAVLIIALPALIQSASWQDTQLIRWINLLLVPAAGSILLHRTSRKARLFLTHLTQRDIIQQRLTDTLRQEGYRISEALAQRVYFQPTYPLLSRLVGQAPVWMEFEDDYILLHGPWSKIQQLEQRVHEGDIFLPKSR